MNRTWDVIEAEPALLGEGPVWDPVSQSLYWVDILQCRIHQYFPATGERKTVGTESMVGAIALKESGGLVAATQNGLIGIDASTKSEQLLASPEAEIPGNRFNDGKCDAAGRFWAGTMSLTGVSQAGALYMLDTDHAITVQLTQVSCSNGLCWSKDCKTFYFIDTPTRQIAAFDFDLRSGRLSKKRIVVTFQKEDGLPDGMTIDTEGMLWVAFWEGWKVARIHHSTGEVLYEIQLPAARVTSCTFGGTDLRDLYITTAQTGISPDRLMTQPLAGAVFVIKNCGFQGMPAVAYKG